MYPSAPSGFFLFHPADRFRGTVREDHRVRRDHAVDHPPRCNHAVVADLRSLQQDAAGSDPAVAADRQLFRLEALVGHGNPGILENVVVVVDLHVLPEQAVVPDGDFLPGAEAAVVVEKAVPDGDLRPGLHPEMEAVPEGGPLRHGKGFSEYGPVEGLLHLCLQDPGYRDNVHRSPLPGTERTVPPVPFDGLHEFRGLADALLQGNRMQGPEGFLVAGDVQVVHRNVHGPGLRELDVQLHVQRLLNGLQHLQDACPLSAAQVEHPFRGVPVHDVQDAADRVVDVDEVPHDGAVAVDLDLLPAQRLVGEGRNRAELAVGPLVRPVGIRQADDPVVQPVHVAVQVQQLFDRRLLDPVGGDRLDRHLLGQRAGGFLSVDRAAGGNENHLPHLLAHAGLEQVGRKQHVGLQFLGTKIVLTCCQCE